MIKIVEPRGLWELFTQGEQAAYRLAFSAGYKQACEELLVAHITAPITVEQVEKMLEKANDYS